MQVEVDTLTIVLSTLPFDNRPVFVTGNFCKWLPDLEEYRMTMVSPGNYRYQFPEDSELPDPIEYKYTRGGWNQVELDRAGKPYGNRIIKAGETLVKDNVIRWQTDISAKTDLSPSLKRFRKHLKSRSSAVPAACACCFHTTTTKIPTSTTRYFT